MLGLFLLGTKILIYSNSYLRITIVLISLFVGPCHHVMERPQFADGGTASDMEDSCE